MQSNPKDNVHVIGAATSEIVSLLKKRNFPVYVFAGFALYLHGLEDKADDGDIRIFTDDFNDAAEYLRASLPAKRTSLRGVRQYSRGQYLNECIEVDDDAVSIDVCSNMVLLCDLGSFEFPYTLADFEDVEDISYEGMALPVASVEFLLLYYLVLRRDMADGKDDEARIQRILASEKLDHDKFLRLVDTLPQAAQLRQLYHERLIKI